jgi:hypothetical protein
MQQVAGIACGRLADQGRRLDLRHVSHGDAGPPQEWPSVRYRRWHGGDMSKPPALSLDGFGAMMVDANGDIK